MPSVTDILDTMDYGPAPEAPEEALSWLGLHSPFGHFINGAFTAAGPGFASLNPATGAVLAEVSQAGARDVAAATAAARAAAPGWAALPDHARATALMALARTLRKRQRFFALLTALDTGTPFADVIETDLPRAIRDFAHAAGRAETRTTDFLGRAPFGCVGLVLPGDLPLPMLTGHLALALAAGATVVVKPSEHSPLCALALAALCTEAGLPPGVVNVITGDGATGAALAQADIDALTFVGRAETARGLRLAMAGSGKALSLALHGKSTHIVFADADLDAAVEGVVETVWCRTGAFAPVGGRLLVAEAALDCFTEKLVERMERLTLGDPLDGGTDLGALLHPGRRDQVQARVSEARAAGASLVQPEMALPAAGAFCPPVLLLGTEPANPSYSAEIPGPVATLTSFRTPAEALELANSFRTGLAATIWTENTTLAQEIAQEVIAGVVGINTPPRADAAAPAGGMRESGAARMGGAAGLKSFLQPSPVPGCAEPAASGGGASQAAAVDTAVSAALKASGWGKKSATSRAETLYALAEALASRADALAAKLSAAGHDPEHATQAVALAFRVAALADRATGERIAAQAKTLTLTQQAPLGVIGIACPTAQPVLGFAALVLPALAMGNSVVALPAPPLADLAGLVHGAGLPAGALTLISGPRDDLAGTLARHDGVDALWYAGTAAGAAGVTRESTGNLKALWCPTERDWSAQPLSETLEQAVQIKTIWARYGA
ncbi:aldehyde dehydrogenase family protein [Rhodobacter lacus]|uniref:Aldehyde dehydrogenase family protein n=1 Tax=Rhodobacter lacus TaxID=1641972 RepID=A0ABW5A7X3_9RHOB